MERMLSVFVVLNGSSIRATFFPPPRPYRYEFLQREPVNARIIPVFDASISRER
jgi:hypothetical protein